ncbi:MAG: protease modulator HflK N-terminal domain-containing protein [Alphaproteobacteria bacterium]|nr:protease modulator HflK N-terminal domain-containing protein [Alphaproteobacteria bacterium]
MAWNPQGGGQGPWGGGGPGAQGPDIEEILRRGQDLFRIILRLIDDLRPRSPARC